ncbi:MAG TPA: hypothetical protein VMU83_12850 [Hanamia sp.]|nr:hypothetical protein [Hanamia sp.]
MSPIKVIITGATGMVGEGVLFECLQNKQVAEVLIVPYLVQICSMALGAWVSVPLKISQN